jgi:broad specificity phosphatase PhoE
MSATKTERLGKPLSIHFVRHAQALYDPETPDSALSPLGVSQARKTAERLARETFDYVYVSSLRRARQTADAILSRHGETKRVITDDIQEVSKFHFYPAPAASLEHFQPTLESERDTLQRFANRIRHDHESGQHVLLICHGNVIRTLIPILSNRNPADSVLMEVYNASITILDLMPSGIGVIRLANSVEHLSPDEITETAAFGSAPSAAAPGQPGFVVGMPSLRIL